MSDTNTPAPPPPRGTSGTSAKEKAVATAASTEIDPVDPVDHTDAGGKPAVGNSVTTPSDEEVKAEEVKTAFNTDPEEVKFEDTYKDSLFTVVDPFVEGESSPFDDEETGFIGTDPYRAVVSEIRQPNPKANKKDGGTPTS